MELKINEKMQKIHFVYFYLENHLCLESENRPIKYLNIFSLCTDIKIRIFCVCYALHIAPFSR